LLVAVLIQFFEVHSEFVLRSAIQFHVMIPQFWNSIE